MTLMQKDNKSARLGNVWCVCPAWLVFHQKFIFGGRPGKIVPVTLIDTIIIMDIAIVTSPIGLWIPLWHLDHCKRPYLDKRVKLTLTLAVCLVRTVHLQPMVNCDDANVNLC